MSVQYRFHWDDETSSEWLPVGAVSADHSWSEPGTYTVTVEARSASETDIVSRISEGFDVEINDDEIIEAADIRVPLKVGKGVSYEFTFGATSSKDHQMEYSINWGAEHHLLGHHSCGDPHQSPPPIPGRQLEANPSFSTSGARPTPSSTTFPSVSSKLPGTGRRNLVGGRDRAYFRRCRHQLYLHA